MSVVPPPLNFVRRVATNDSAARSGEKVMHTSTSYSIPASTVHPILLNINIMTVPIHYLPLSATYSFLAGLVYVVYAAYTDTRSPITGPAQSVSDFIPVVYVTVSSILLYYVFLYNQSATVFVEFAKAKREHRDKKKEGEAPSLAKIKYGLDNFTVIAANRCAGNYGEQLIPFLISLYLHSLFVSVEVATKCGWCWLMFRSYYSWAFKMPFPGLFLSTMPAYFCIWWMIGSTVVAISK
jgi:hypothetical protein